MYTRRWLDKSCLLIFCLASAGMLYAPNDLFGQSIRGVIQSGDAKRLANVEIVIQSESKEYKTKTDNQGEFDFDPNLAKNSIIVAFKAGYRRNGLVMNGFVPEVVISLVPDVEPDANPLFSRTNFLRDDQIIELGNKLVEPIWHELLRDPQHPQKQTWLGFIASFRPDDTIEFMSHHEDASGNGEYSARRILSTQIASENIEKAIDIAISGHEDPGTKILYLQMIFRELDDKSEKNDDAIRKVVNAAIALATQDTREQVRSHLLPICRSMLMNSGREREARELVSDEDLQRFLQIRTDVTLEFIKKQNYPMYQLPRQLNGLLILQATNDPSMALRTIAPYKNEVIFDQLLMPIATIVARTDAKHAVEILNQGNRPAGMQRIPNYELGQICYLIARNGNVEDAMKIVELGITPRVKAWCLAGIAQAIASTNLEQATKLIGSAFELLENSNLISNKVMFDSFHSVTVACAILPVIESIDANLIREYVWRTALMAPLRNKWDGEGNESAVIFNLAASLARYDEEIARYFFDQVNFEISLGLYSNYFEAVMVLDPYSLATELESMPDGDQGYRMRSRQHVLALLSPGSSSTIWDEITNKHRLSRFHNNDEYRSVVD